jgi:pilus assembly protein CpaB
MKPKTMILMGLAITCGLGASYMTSRLLAERTTPDDEKVIILVANRKLSLGYRLTKPEEVFDQKEVRRDDEPPDAIKDYEALKGKIMKMPRNKGDHVTASNLLGENESLQIPEGHKAIGLRVNLENTASGFATLPQSRVNLIWTVRGQDASSSFAQVLLENVLVLAADIKLNRDGELASPAQVATFALTDEDILKVSVAKELGTLSLVLRNLDDPTRAAVKRVGGGQLREKDDLTKVTPQEPVKPQVVEPKKPDNGPKFTRYHTDIVNGSHSGTREVLRVHYNQYEDGTVEVTGTEVIAQPTPPQQAPSKGPKEF